MAHQTGVVWVAGVGASAGLGAAVARRFAREKLIAVISGRTASRLDAVAAEIRAAGGQAHVLPLDVSIETDVAAAARERRRHAGEGGTGVVVVISCAMGLPRRPCRLLAMTARSCFDRLAVRGSVRTGCWPFHFD